MVKQGFILMLFCVALFACNSINNKENASNDTKIEEIKTDARLISTEKLFEGIELPVFVEIIKANQDKKLIAPTGAEIKVPANAFVDKDGNEIKGEVTIKYKEIKSPADIIIENIDMTYDSAGQTYQFMTAGMFDLRAYSGENEVLLKAGKSIEVSYISDKKGNYGFYQNNGGWKYIGVPKENVLLKANIENEQVPGVLMPTVANADEDLIIDIKTSHKNIPELSIFKTVLWKYNGNLSNEEVANVLGKPVSNTSLEASKKKGEYIYKFTNQKGTYEFPVKPVFSPKVMKEAIKSYNDALAKLNTSPKIKRTVDVTQLGLMNYDAIYHRPDAILVDVDFKIKNNEQTKVQGLPLFHITGADDVLVNITDQKNIYYSKNLNNKIVAVLPGHKVAVMSTSDFIRSMKNRQIGKQVVLELTEIDAKINSSSDLNNIISGL
jgi:hypothetical protein